MTDTERLGDDLAYIRAAINRQRRLACEYIPAWLAAGAGGFFFLGAVIKDLRLQGIITETTGDAIIIVAMVGLLLALFRNRRRNPASRCGGRQQASLRERVIYGLPALVFLAGLGLFIPVFEQLGIAQDARMPIIMLYSAVCLILIGLRGVSAATGMGLGLAVGMMVKIFLAFAYSTTVFGLCIALGLIAGAWADRRALAADTGHGHDE